MDASKVLDTYNEQSERTRESLAGEGVERFTFTGFSMIGVSHGKYADGFCVQCWRDTESEVRTFSEVTDLTMLEPETADDPAQFDWQEGDTFCAECGEEIYHSSFDDYIEAAREDEEMRRWEADKDERGW